MKTKTAVTNKLGHKIKTLREKKGWTMPQLAQHLDISLATLYRWEGNEWRPRLHHLPRIANAFGVTLDELMS